MSDFGQRLQERIIDRGPLCVGIDPSSQQVLSWERTDDPEGLEFVALSLLEAASGVATAIKVQVAFFERFGARGYAVLERLLEEARSADLIVIADAKRGDIGSTNDGYADAWLSDRSPLRADALTVHPYLGLGAFGRLVALARESNRGLFVVVASSNPEGRSLQTARTDSGELVEDRLLREIAELNADAHGIGPFGAVVGATRDRPRYTLSNTNGPFLVPGLGAQGATPEDVARLFSDTTRGTVLASVSRSIAQAGPTRRALADAVARWSDDLRGALA